MIRMQLRVVNEEAAERARVRGVTVVMNRCLKIEFRRLFERARQVRDGRGFRSGACGPDAFGLQRGIGGGLLLLIELRGG